MSGRLRGEGLGIPSPQFGCYTASPGQYTNTGCRVVLVSLYGPSFLTVTCSLFSWFDSGYYLRQSTSASVGTETDTHSAYCACFGRLHSCSSWTRCARTSLCNDRCRPFSGPPCCGAEAVSMVWYGYGFGRPSLEREVHLGFSCSQLQLRSSMWCRSQSL